MSNAPQLGGLLLATVALSFVMPAAPADDTVFRLRCEQLPREADSPVTAVRVATSAITPGELLDAQESRNDGSWRFDGQASIAYAVPSSTAGFSENFTWEGFFLPAASNAYSTETGIADRLVTQFAFDKGNWTRLAIGLVADRDGKPRLSVELEGFEGRTFGLGRQVVVPARWHHFALVHEGTAAAARIRWYLDYELTGELFLGGQANQNTLRPPGSSRFTIGARLLSGQAVNRGFTGLIDEVRLTPRPRSADEFLRCDGESFNRVVESRDPMRKSRNEFWADRHEWARDEVATWPMPQAPESIDGHFDNELTPISDAAFLRRLSLTVRGRIPSLDETTAFLSDTRPDKRLRAIDGMLASPGWADGWVGYWQDVLAENPSVVFPTLNNSGAFRQWIHDSFRDNRPFDRFVTELMLMEGDVNDDGPAGFSLATGNDAPMAMRANVAMKAFAAVDLKCSRCHDSPVDDFRQADLFQLAAYLNGQPLKVPATSVAAIGKAAPGVITTSLSAGQDISATGLVSHWLEQPEQAAGLKAIEPGNPRAELAALVTSPRNSRFSDVIVNRVWQRYFGTTLVESVDHWNESPTPAKPDLLRTLSRDFVVGGYDVQALARRILASAAWQSTRETRGRMSAEQVVDSLFTAVGKDFQAETMGVHATDPGAVHLPKPQRAWQFAALPNERDRPALGMPVNQTIVDVMTTFGWNGSRQQPRTEREQVTSALQPLMLFNGTMSQRIVRLSEASAITPLCLDEVPVETLVDRLFLTVLTRLPDRDERAAIAGLLRPDYDQRITGAPRRRFVPLSTFQPDWRKHLEPEQTRLMLAAQQRVARGESPTARLTDEFRERVEDVLWALINSPEFVVIP